ncbi:MAG: PPC domain-containing protein [Planctomycetota bacterium]|nr:PPC domain-containing protein [Planctomycetota bacterium]MDA1178174.1 PPC domain-containing protein [Planctomycetota bacterium]
MSHPEEEDGFRPSRSPSIASRLTVRSRPLLVAIVVWWLGAGYVGQLAGAVPTLTDIRPRALQPGATTEISLHGTDFQDVTHIWTSFPARCEIIPSADAHPTTEADSKSKPQQVRCRMTLGRDAQLGFGAVRLATKEGVSGWLLLMIDDLPSVAESSGNSRAEVAQIVERSVGIEGTTDPLIEDYFCFQAEAGQTSSFEVVAQRLGSPLDPVLKLYDARGALLASVDDDLGSGADCRLAYRFPTAGKYYVAVRDVRFRGGVEFRYRMRIGRFPLVSVAYPLGARRGTVADFEWIGQQVDGIASQSISVHDSLALGVGQQSLSVAKQRGDGPEDGSGFVTIAVGNAIEMMESEPNDLPSQANSIATMPLTVNGRFRHAGDIDRYRIALEKEQRIEVRTEGRRYGSPADVYLQLWNSEGRAVAEAVSTASDGGRLTFQCVEPGVYHLTAEDTEQGSGPERVYRLSIELQRPGFSLMAHADTLNVPRGGVLSLKVTAERREYTGPITLQLAGLTSPVQLENNVIPADKNDVELKATLSESLEPGELHCVQVLGTGDGLGTANTETASTLTALRARVPDALAAPRFLDRTIAVGIGPTFPEFFTLQVESNQAYFGKIAGTGTFKVQVNRLVEAFTEPIAITVEGMPENCTVDVQPIGSGQTETVATISGPADLSEGERVLQITGTGVFQNQKRKFLVANVPLRVIPPLRVHVKPPSPFKINEPQKVVVQVQRFGKERHPVSLLWKRGPAEILAPIQVVIPEDKDDVELPLLATSEFSLVDAPQLVVTASTTVQGQLVVVDSEPVQLSIQSTPKDGAP